jgi:hypothetical protein
MRKSKQEQIVQGNSPDCPLTGCLDASDSPALHDELEVHAALAFFGGPKMPRYEFYCEDCKKPFEIILTIAEYE